MTYRVELTTKKPANVKWFSEASERAKQAATMIKQTAGEKPVGMLSYKRHLLDPNTLVEVFEFESEKHYNDYRTGVNTNPWFAARVKYNKDVGMVVTKSAETI